MAYGKRPVWTYIVLIIAAIAIIFGPLIYYSMHWKDYDQFHDSFYESCLYAEENDCLTAEYNGVTTLVNAKNNQKIRNAIFTADISDYIEIIPEGEPITLDFGNSNAMNIWKNSTESIIVQYIYPDKTYVLFQSSDEEVCRFADFERLISEDWENTVIDD